MPVFLMVAVGVLLKTLSQQNTVTAELVQNTGTVTVRYYYFQVSCMSYTGYLGFFYEENN